MASVSEGEKKNVGRSSPGGQARRMDDVVFSPLTIVYLRTSVRNTLSTRDTKKDMKIVKAVRAKRWDQDGRSEGRGWISAC
jgi:hypothetical protein